MGRPDEEAGREVLRLPSHEDILARPARLMEATLLLERQVHQMRAVAVQPVGDRVVVLEPPAPALTTEELDELYTLPFTRQAHPSYTAPIPAVETMLTSMTCHRGCGGGCSFCSLALHQGRRVASRSRDSLLEEARTIAAQPGFTGAISDVGGPSANMWKARCSLDPARCRRSSCMVPRVCPGFSVDQTEHVRLLRDIRQVPGIRHVRVASGVRFDLALQQDAALEAYAGEFTGGQLKVAPEHCADEVLRLMRKPGMEPFERFLDAFRRYSEAHGKEQYVVPYLMSAFPGCTDAHMRRLADWLEERHWSPRQVQCFVPTPGTVATAMYYAEVDTEGHPLPVAKPTRPACVSTVSCSVPRGIVLAPLVRTTNGIRRPPPGQTAPADRTEDAGCGEKSGATRSGVQANAGNGVTHTPAPTSGPTQRPEKVMLHKGGQEIPNTRAVPYFPDLRSSGIFRIEA